MGILRRVGYAMDDGVYYLLQDHLHSSSATVAQNGTLSGARNYFYPFGGNRGGAAFNGLTTKRFTGQYHEQAIPGGEGLSYYGARWYDAQLGRFVTPDSVVPKPANPQDFNRYSYVRNNPLKYVDPSGHEPLDGDTYPCGWQVCVGNMRIPQGTPYDAYKHLLRDPEERLRKEDVRTGLTTCGIVFPICDAANAGWYALDGEWGNAGLSAASIVPGGEVLKLGKAARTIRGGTKFIAGIDSVVGSTIVRRITSPLSDLVKDKVWREARRIYDVINPGIRQSYALEVHHRIPLEWAHLFPYANPNRAANLVGIPHSIHRMISNEWTAFRTGLAGRSPSAYDVWTFARSLDRRYSAYYR